MRFTPKTEAEIDSENLIPVGEYDFEIITAEERFSKAGNEMIVIKLRIFFEDSERFIYDYLMESVAYKLRHAAEACGALAEYNQGELSSHHLEGGVGRCKVGIQKNKSGDYPDRNVIKDYLMAPPQGISGAAKKVHSGGGNHIDDDIPF